MIVGFYGDVNKIELAYYLVIVYFTALEWLMNNELKIIWKEAVVA
jgi:hypothetical protein